MNAISVYRMTGRGFVSNNCFTEMAPSGAVFVCAGCPLLAGKRPLDYSGVNHLLNGQ